MVNSDILVTSCCVDSETLPTIYIRSHVKHKKERKVMRQKRKWFSLTEVIRIVGKEKKKIHHISKVKSTCDKIIALSWDHFHIHHEEHAHGDNCHSTSSCDISHGL